MSDIAKAAGWDQNFLWSGHSIRATTITTLLDAGHNEAEVKQISGHRSDSALRTYRRSEKTKRRLCETLAGPSTSNDFPTTSNDFASTSNNTADLDSDSSLELQMSQIPIEISDFDSDDTIEYDMSQIEIPPADVTPAPVQKKPRFVFNNCYVKMINK